MNEGDRFPAGAAVPASISLSMTICALIFRISPTTYSTLARTSPALTSLKGICRFSASGTPNRRCVRMTFASTSSVFA